ncbi:MAG: hypothetical protein C4337_05150 [Armatimonadota bacterium]
MKTERPIWRQIWLAVLTLIGGAYCYAQPPDREPPTIVVYGVEDMGDYYGKTLEIQVSAADDRDPNVEIKAFLNGEPVDASGIILVSRPGWYALWIEACDSSGNCDRVFYEFRIRDIPLYKVFVIPHGISYKRVEEDRWRFEGTFYIASREIDLSKISLHTLILWLEDENGKPIGELILPRKQAEEDSGCTPPPIDVEEIQPVYVPGGYLRVRFKGELTAYRGAGVPSRFLLTGGGYANPETRIFDLEGQGNLVSVTDPIAELERLGFTSARNVPTVPDEINPRHCRWRSAVRLMPRQDAKYMRSGTSSCPRQEEVDALAHGKQLRGFARAIDPPCHGNPAVAFGRVESGYIYTGFGLTRPMHVANP